MATSVLDTVDSSLACGMFDFYHLASFLGMVMLIRICKLYRRRQQRSSPKKEEGEPTAYLLHPKEWIAWVCLLVMLLYLRFISFSSHNSWLVHHPFARSDGVIGYQLVHYCSIDIEMLCSNAAEEAAIATLRTHEDCERLYGPFLSRKMGPYLDSNKNRQSRNESSSLYGDVHECGLHMQLQLRNWFPVEKDKLLPHIKDKSLLDHKDALAVARLVTRVLFLERTEDSLYTCSNGGSFSLQRYDGGLRFHPTNTELEMLHRFYVEQFLSVFATPMAVDNRLITQTWTRLQVLDIIMAVATASKRFTSPLSTVVGRMIQEEQAQGSTRITSLAPPVPNSNLPSASSFAKNNRVSFVCNPIIDQCVQNHFDGDTLVTHSCAYRTKQAFERAEELIHCPLSWEGISSIHFLFLSINLIWLLRLIHAKSIHSRLKKKLDKRQRQLEQELSDPFLREGLERKAQKLQKGDQFMLELEEIVRNWNSSAKATRLAKAWIRGLRLQILVVLVLNSIYGLLLLRWKAISMGMLLESVFLGFLMLTLSYSITIPECKEVASPEASRGLLDGVLRPGKIVVV